MSKTGKLAYVLRDLGGFCDAGYLKFLAGRVPPDISEQVLKGSDLEMMDTLEVEDVLAPLQVYSFPRDKLQDFAWYFDAVTMGLVFDTREYDVYAAVYLCSLYVHLFTTREGGHDMMPEVVAVMVKECLDTDIETQIQVMKFLMWECGELRSEGPRSACHRPFYVAGVSLLWASILDTMVGVARRDADEAPARDTTGERGILAHAGFDITWRKLVERVFGEEGEVIETVKEFQALLGRRGYHRGKTEGGSCPS